MITVKQVFKEAIYWLALTLPFWARGQGTPEPAGGGTIELENPLSADNIPEILNRIIDFLLIVAAPVAIIMAIWAGFLLLSSGGSEDKVKKGRDTLLWVVIGVGVLILSKGIVSLARSFLQ